MQNNTDLINQIKIVANNFQAANFIDAISKSKKLLHKIPNNEFLLNIIGLSYLNLGKLDDAKNLYLKIIKLNPKIISFKNNYANVLKALDRFDEAEKILNELIKSDPKYINAINNLANLRKDLKDFERSIELLNKALAIEPKNITVLYNLALCHRSLRNYDQVLKYAELINGINPNFTQADKIISEIKNYKNSDANQHLDYMDKKIKELNLTNDQKIPLHFSLGKAYEDKEQYEISFDHYIKGNKLRRASFEFDITDEVKKFNLIKKKFENIEINQSQNTKDKKIVFICGMPRSGTTLLEQIISAHTKVDSLGETEFLGKIFNKIDFRNFDLKETYENFIFNDYIHFTKKLKINNDFLTDKSLLNFQLIGLIKIFFPGSKVLVLNRDFNNNFFSIFKNELLGPQLKWTFDINEIKQFYKLFNDYIEFWNKIFPGFIMEVNYEKLVNNTEEVAKDVLNYCGLEWEENCLHYYKKNKSSIDTASANQANKPIYKSSLNKFEAYKKFFNLK